MIDFSTVPPPPGALDTEKRVRYSLGLVLGVDEFEQEQFYFLERDRQHNRALHGYGTVCGLRLTVEGTKVLVTAGLAVNPQGKLIRVPRDQCADLNDWLNVPKNQEALAAQFGSLLEPPALYVVLCYRECATNKVPIPGAPCRAEGDTLAPSRVTESFELKFSTQAPHAEEEQAVRRFGELLRQIEITDTPAPGTVLTIADMEDRVRALLVGSAPLFGSPVEGETLLLHPDDAAAVLRAGLRVWITEVRPKLLSDGKSCAGQTPDEDCVLLGRLDFDVSPGWQVEPLANPLVTVDEDDRPYLVHTRLLQEWLLRGWGATFEPGSGSPIDLPLPDLQGDVTGSVTSTTVVGLQNTPVAPTAPLDGQVLMYMQAPDQWQPTDLPALGGDLSGAIESATVERIQNTPVEPIVPAANQVLTGLPDASGVVRWQPADLPAIAVPSLAGDVTGTVGANTVEKIQGVQVVPPPAGGTLSQGQVLTVNAAQEWEATTPTPPVVPNLGGDVTGTVGANTVEKIQGVQVVPPPAGGTLSQGQVLTVNAAQEWEATTLTPPVVPNLGGDVTGVIGANTVGRIRGVPVVSPPVGGTLSPRQILMVNAAQEWEAVEPTFVEYPAKQVRYGIVAAGIVSANNPRKPTYNDLIIRPPTTDGQLIISFTGYTLPQDAGGNWSHHYIVKVLPVLPGVVPFRNVAFVRFMKDEDGDGVDDGILLFIADRGQPIPLAELGDVELMIEVSLFPFA